MALKYDLNWKSVFGKQVFIEKSHKTKMEVLESHMSERLRLSSCLVNDVCLNSGDLSASTIRASAATSNSIAFEVAELSAKLATAREDIGRFKEDVEWVRTSEITHKLEGGG